VDLSLIILIFNDILSDTALAASDRSESGLPGTSHVVHNLEPRVEACLLEILPVMLVYTLIKELHY